MAIDLVIRHSTQAMMEEHARECFPNECCGIIVDCDGDEQVVRVTNIQDQLHAQDPEAHPRTARTAYHMGPEAQPVLLSAARGEVAVRAFFHSHPDHDVYFSDEDKERAMAWDEPMYPEAGQIVISVYAGEVKGSGGFRWDADTRDFVPVTLRAE